jgi:carboxyl-terminal processing protease
LNYGAQLKITTARYYTPSGRSIQEIDYVHKDGSGVFTIVPDSLKGEFKTLHGRTVLGHGGVAPDSIVNNVDEGPMVRELIRKALFFKFAVRYVGEHKDGSITAVTPEILNAFKKFLVAEKFDYQEESEVKVKELRQVAERSHYGKDALAGIDALSAALDREKDRGFERYKDHLADELSIELMGRLRGEHGRIEASLKDDVQLRAAVNLLRDQKSYSRKIGG